MNTLDHLKDRILERVNLPQFIGKTVALKTRSGLWVGLCPFHDERSPSFTVYPDHYFCFGCQQSGDAITFIRKTNGLSFMDALKQLGGEVGVDVSEIESAQNLKKNRQDDAELYKILLAAQDLFTNNLFSSRGQNVLTYLEQRGFNRESMRKFGFGYAFDEPTFMLDNLVKQRFSPRDIDACSLASPSAKNGKLFDFFRNRLTVPIHDVSGRIIAFGGRAMDDYPPKYKNSRETRLFDKSATLFGLHHAKSQLRKGMPAIVVEGYMDTLQMWQFGFENTVACMGTALKKSHLQMLGQLTGKVILLFDGDNAGQKASLSTVNVGLEVPNLKIEVVVLSGKDDPDSFLLKNGKDAMQSLLNKPQDLLDFALRSKLADVHGLGLAALVKNEFLPWLAKISDKMQRSFLIAKLADLSGISRVDIETELREGLRKSLSPAPTPRGAGAQVALPRTLPVRPLTTLEFDLFGQLFFAKPNEFASPHLDAPPVERRGSPSLDDVEKFLHSELNLDDLWLEFAQELIATLRKQAHPFTQPSHHWVSANDPMVAGMIEKLMERSFAFAEGNHSEQIQRIMHEKQRQNLRSSVSKLKSQLATANPEQSLEILKSIKNINSKMDGF